MKTFIFDFDSTIFPGESLDEIIQHSLEGNAQSEEKKKEITTICNLGMSGTISMEDSLKRRLEIASPTKEDIYRYVENNLHRIDSRIKSLIKLIHDGGHKVFVISGGFEEWIKPLLKGIVPAENIHANQIINAERPMLYENILRRDKENIIKGLNTKSSEIIMIGDGATDFSVFDKGIAQHFVGAFFYTGAEARKKVVEKALAKSQAIFTEKDKFLKYMYTFL